MKIQENDIGSTKNKIKENLYKAEQASKFIKKKKFEDSLDNIRARPNIKRHSWLFFFKSFQKRENQINQKIDVCIDSA